MTSLSPRQSTTDLPRASRSSTRLSSASRLTSPAGVLTRRTSLPVRYQYRGLTPKEIESYGLVDDEPRSRQFESLPISQAEIKKLPRKDQVRQYYRDLAALHDHYIEVDGLLQGELPGKIASSFQASRNSRHRTERGEIDYDTVNEHVHWNGGSQAGGKGKGRVTPLVGDQEDVEYSGERTGLLSSEEKEAERERAAQIAINVNTVINILLVAAKGVAVVYSSSISLTASLVDSALDLLSTFIILGTTWAIGLKTDKHKYPAGKRRFEPLGVLIFSVAMIASFVQVFIESFQRATHDDGEPPVDLSAIGMGTMLATIGVKTIVWFWCSRMPSSGVQALAQDAENDVWFNIMSLAFPTIGQKLHWRLLDPIGGMVLSTYIIIEWIKTLFLNFAKLSGKSASSDQLTRVLYLVSRFNPVLEIGDVECYHIGDDVMVEIDVILPQSSTLHFAHDVGETIQCCLESLDGVIRAYVHCDYSSSNPPQHTSRVSGPTASQVPSKLSNGYGSTDSSGSVTPKPSFLAANGLTGSNISNSDSGEVVSPKSEDEETSNGRK